MQYRKGNLGRIFVAKLDHGDDLLAEIECLVTMEHIEAGIFYLIGALKKASLVAGPKECTIPPEQLWQQFDDGREILGIGTIFQNQDNHPSIHLHGTLGKGDKPLTGCIRLETEVYLVAELIILELLDTHCIKKMDPISGFHLLGFADQETKA